MALKFNQQGLIPAIAQDVDTGQVLMLGYMNMEALKRSLDGGEVWYYSRSRESLWRKGEVSGNFLKLIEVFLDCDEDTILLRVKPEGPTCHTGNKSCFFIQLEDLPEVSPEEVNVQGPYILDQLFALIQERKRDMPPGSYTKELFEQGIGRIAQKVIEESGESAISALQGQLQDLPREIADLLYHLLVLMSASGITPEDVWNELRARRK